MPTPSAIPASSDSICSFFTYPTKFGPVTVGVEKDLVNAVVLGDATLPGIRRASTASTACANQIMEYLAGKRTAFSIAFHAKGSEFQQQVWKAAANIPYGQTRTAQEVAVAIGSPTSYRAVGSALRACPTPLLIPTHRVTAANGNPLGTGHAAEVASALMALETRRQ